MGISGLERGNRSKVFRRIVAQLQTDPNLRTVVKSWNTWTGSAFDAVKPGAQGEIEIELIPTPGSMAWFSPDSQVGTLRIEVRVTPPGSATGTSSADDCLDLGELIEQAVYPSGDHVKQLKFEQELRDLGASTGQIQFVAPPAPQETADGLVCIGAMQIDVLRTFFRK